MFSLHVTAAGTVDDVVIRSVPKPALGFEEAVTSAARTWRFDPATSGGRPVDGWFIDTVTFSLLLPAHLASMYAVPHAAAWQALLDVVTEAKLGIDERREAQGLLITKSVEVSRDRFGVGPPDLPVPFDKAAVQFYVFVSPFAEPARVYVGSLVIGSSKAQVHDAPEASLVVYNSWALGTWLLARITQRLNVPAQLIPQTVDRRNALAQSLLPYVDACLKPNRAHTGVVKDPVPIYRMDPVYPEDQLALRNTATVDVDGMVDEDGAFVPLRVRSDTPVSPTIEGAALAAAELWRFRPFQDGNCAAAGQITVELSFRLHR